MATTLDIGDLLGPIFELLCLAVRRRRVGLGPADATRLVALLRLLGSPGVDPRRFARAEVMGRAQIVPACGPIVCASVLDVGAGGMRVSGRCLPPVGAQATVVLLDPVRSLRLVFPVLVIWTIHRLGAEGGLRFVGLPQQLCSRPAGSAQEPSRLEAPTVPARAPRRRRQSAAVASR